MCKKNKLENTEIYITLEKAIFGDQYNQKFHVKVGSTSEEIKALLEVGFEYVCDKKDSFSSEKENSVCNVNNPTRRGKIDAGLP